MRLLALLAAIVALTGATAPTPLLVTTRTVVVYVNGDARRTASAGPGAVGYRLLSTMPDGSVLVQYEDAGFVDVEAITPNLAPRTVKTFPGMMAGFIGPAPDGFVQYDPIAHLLRRYDTHGSMVGVPTVATGAQTAIGVGDTNVVFGSGQLIAYDRQGRGRRGAAIEGGALVALSPSRFAAVDTRFGLVRIYTTDLQPVATLRPNTPQIRALAAGPDGSLAILSGMWSCGASNSQIEFYADVTSSQPPVRMPSTGTTISLAVGADTIYAVDAACPGNANQDGAIAMFGRDGTLRGTLVNVGAPTGVLPFPGP